MTKHKILPGNKGNIGKIANSFQKKRQIYREKGLCFFSNSGNWRQEICELSIGKNISSQNVDDNYDGMLDSSSMQESSETNFELIDVFDTF